MSKPPAANDCMTDQTTQETTPKCPECGQTKEHHTYCPEHQDDACNSSLVTALTFWTPTPTVEGSGRTEDAMLYCTARPLTDDELLSVVDRETAGYRLHDALVAELRSRLVSSPTAARGVTGLYCAQCFLNGAGRFRMREDGNCPNPSCVLYGSGHRARPADLSAIQPTPLTWEDLDAQVDVLVGAAFGDGRDGEPEASPCCRKAWDGLLSTLRTLLSAAEQGERDTELLDALTRREVVEVGGTYSNDEEFYANAGGRLFVATTPRKAMELALAPRPSSPEGV